MSYRLDPRVVYKALLGGIEGMINKVWLASVICVASLLSNGIAFAADSGFYLGLGVGTSRASFEGNGVAGVAAGTAVSNDKSSFGWKEYGGYRFNKNAGIELSFADLGKSDLTVTLPGATPVTGKATFTGFGIAAVGTIPSNMGLSLFGKVGGFYSTVNTSTSVNVFNSGTTTGSKEHRFVPNIGVGVDYELTPRIGLRAEYERFLKVGSDTKTIDTDVNMFTVGLNYKF
jgi:opacity protein-like surface antigen